MVENSDRMQESMTPKEEENPEHVQNPTMKTPLVLVMISAVSINVEFTSFEPIGNCNWCCLRLDVHDWI